MTLTDYLRTEPGLTLAILAAWLITVVLCVVHGIELL